MMSDGIHGAGSGARGTGEQRLSLVFGCWRMWIAALDREGALLPAQAHLTHGTERISLCCPEELVDMLARVESPAEAKLAVALAQHVSEPGWTVTSQEPVAGYRLDFAVYNRLGVESFGERPCRIGIEVDGHEWHERTKTQAARDKSRDRAIQAEGWKVLRFTGSEVWNDPVRCAQEIAAIQRKSEGES